MQQNKLHQLDEIINNNYNNMTGIMIQQNGDVIYEQYFHGYQRNQANHVFSVTKSVFSILIGIAIAKGFIKSLDQKVLEFFPDYTIPAGEKTIQDITIRHLVTMTAPYKYDTEPYELFFSSHNPIRDALDLLGGEKKIGKFNYAAIGGPYILAGILAKATGQPVLDFAMENLFVPLGIGVDHNIELHSEEEHMAIMSNRNTTGWVVDPQGINTASWGLFLTPTDMAKIGQLYLNRGIWDGKQIVPAAWIDESTKEQSRWEEANLPYGYLWWIIDEKSSCYAAMGDGGNIIYVNTKKKLVVSSTAFFTPDAKDRIEFVMKFVEPLFED